MARIHFRQHTGTVQTVEASPGQTVMEVATGAMVRGIVGECGGCCSCATCHVHVDADWYGRLPPADDMETAMLEGAVEPGPRSRLSCQIKVTEALDGLSVAIPAGQV
ncbi:2Fe-2S iron-sulfur cluster-binding protein [Arenimonas sp.]|uniref:2Fe-2S iron-sulfur cluster-binding protein n=1 Tax=Arenimonas sp. TaxID=1872635 RepID=UPI002E316C6A|nr:2Fe-2S iron-sulfur cluster-binding protein [Arenimonas sp.]HEX4853633.1 2Fe-2S iron-sulfur cluster-binding protein [Arenimonas sp.]